MSPASCDTVTHKGASEPSDIITVADANTSIGREEGNNSRPGHEDATRDLSTTGDNPLGTGKEAQSFQIGLCTENDAKMDLKTIEMRFNQATRICLKPAVQPSYLETFRRLFNHGHLERYSKRQLAGPKGKQIILDFLQTVPKPSQANTLAKLKKVWMAGIGLPWPIDRKMDIGRLPKTRREGTPDDSIVKQWAEAMSREADPYLRLLWLFDGEFGWRPSHCCAMRWSDLQYEDGKPYAIIAEGENGQFKTYSPVVAWLPPEVVKALEEWKVIHPSPTPNALILPFKNTIGEYDARKQMNTLGFERHWLKLQKKYSLPKLRPKDMRHWLATKARMAGMSENARAYLQGHDPTSFNPSMGTLYDNESREKALEEQARLFPNGALALLMPAQVEILDDLPSEAVSLLKQFMAGELDSYEFMPQLMTLRKQLDKVKLAKMGM